MRAWDGGESKHSACNVLWRQPRLSPAPSDRCETKVGGRSAFGHRPLDPRAHPQPLPRRSCEGLRVCPGPHGNREPGLQTPNPWFVTKMPPPQEQHLRPFLQAAGLPFPPLPCKRRGHRPHLAPRPFFTPVLTQALVLWGHSWGQQERFPPEQLGCTACKSSLWGGPAPQPLPLRTGGGLT